jgi:plasmid stabilization system protein ParE
MPHKVCFSGEALSQITAICDYIALDSPENALRWVERLNDLVGTLSTFPERHEVLYNVVQAGREVRQTFYGIYRILYEIQNDTVFILAVRHGARRPIGPTEIEGKE